MLHFQRWKVILILGIVIAGILFALPNLFPAATMARMPTWLPHKQVNLGLDLQGGAHLLYQLDEKEMTERLAQQHSRRRARDFAQGPRRLYRSRQNSLRAVSVTIRDAADMDKALPRCASLPQPVGGNVFSGFSGYDLDVARQGDDDVSLIITDAGLTHRMASAIQASIETIRRRVDAFGTTEPSIQREGTRPRARAGARHPGRRAAKKLIGETGKLEFKLVDPSVNAAQAADHQASPDRRRAGLWQSAERLASGSPQIPYVLKSQCWSVARTWSTRSPASISAPASRW